MAHNAGYIGRAPGDSSPIIARQVFTPGGSTSEFTVDAGYDVGYLDVYKNGLKIIKGTDYTASNGSSFTLTVAVGSGNTLEAVSYKAFNLANPISNASGGDLVVGGKLTVSGISSLTDVVSSGIVTADSFSGGWSGALSVTDTTASTSTSTGALIVSGGVGIGKSLFVGEGISIAGTITYNDVTNVDSVGIVTAGKGLRATTGGVIITAGVSTLSGGVNLNTGNLKVTAGIASIGAGVTISSDFIHLGDNKKIQLGIASDLTIQHNATNSVINNTTGQLRVAGDDVRIMNKDEDETYATFANDGAATLYHDNSAKLSTIGAGVSVFGGLRIQSGLMRERVNISATALNSAKVINVSDGMVHYRSSAVGAASVKLNVISNAGINTDLAIGDTIAVTVSTITGNTAHFVDQIQVDGVEASAGVTTYWTGGSAPSDGSGATAIDNYAFNIMKTANATYIVVANQTKGS